MEKLWSHEKQLQFLNNLKNSPKHQNCRGDGPLKKENIWMNIFGNLKRGLANSSRTPLLFIIIFIKRLSSKNKNEVWFFWGFVIILLQYILFVIYKSFLNALAIFLTIYHSNVLIPPYLNLVVTNVVALFYKKEQKIYEKILDGSIIFEENTSKWTKNTPMCPN